MRFVKLFLTPFLWFNSIRPDSLKLMALLLLLGTVFALILQERVQMLRYIATAVLLYFNVSAVCFDWLLMVQKERGRYATMVQGQISSGNPLIPKA
jgi:hypothetical protein